LILIPCGSYYWGSTGFQRKKADASSGVRGRCDSKSGGFRRLDATVSDIVLKELHKFLDMTVKTK